MNIKLLSIVLSATLLLTACATPVATTPHSATSTNEYKKFATPTEAARLYFLNGVTTGPVIITLRHAFPAVLFANGQEIGGVNKNDVLVADIKPGTYEFIWKPPTEVEPAQSKPLSLSVKSGDVLILRGNFNAGGTGFGVIGSMIAPTAYELISTKDRSGITDLNFVKATECPETICVNTK